MEHEEHSVEPALQPVADLRVDRLVLRDEEAGECRESDVDREGVRRARAHEDQPRVAGRDADGVDRMPYPLPSAEPTPPVTPTLVGEHRQRLERDRREEKRKGNHGTCLRKTPPQTVSPGPKARLTTSVPSRTAESSRMRIHTWGSVADDMLP